MPRRPSFQFYPGDWRNDEQLRLVSVGARGLWIEMICIMHQADPYGCLKVGPKVILPDNLCRLVGATLEETEGWLAELEAVGVYSTENDCIVCRRMIRDEEIRRRRADGGKKGGNPALMKKKSPPKVNLTTNLADEPKDRHGPTPSPSPSPSPSPHEGVHISIHPDVRIPDALLQQWPGGRFQKMWVERLRHQMLPPPQQTTQLEQLARWLADGVPAQDLEDRLAAAASGGWASLGSRPKVGRRQAVPKLKAVREIMG